MSAKFSFKKNITPVSTDFLTAKNVHATGIFGGEPRRFGPASPGPWHRQFYPARVPLHGSRLVYPDGVAAESSGAVGRGTVDCVAGLESGVEGPGSAISPRAGPEWGRRGWGRHGSGSREEREDPGMAGARRD